METAPTNKRKTISQNKKIHSVNLWCTNWMPCAFKVSCGWKTACASITLHSTWAYGVSGGSPCFGQEEWSPPPHFSHIVRPRDATVKLKNPDGVSQWAAHEWLLYYVNLLCLRALSGETADYTFALWAQLISAWIHIYIQVPVLLYWQILLNPPPHTPTRIFHFKIHFSR